MRISPEMKPALKPFALLPLSSVVAFMPIFWRTIERHISVDSRSPSLAPSGPRDHIVHRRSMGLSIVHYSRETDDSVRNLMIEKRKRWKRSTLRKTRDRSRVKEGFRLYDSTTAGEPSFMRSGMVLAQTVRRYCGQQRATTLRTCPGVFSVPRRAALCVQTGASSCEAEGLGRVQSGGTREQRISRAAETRTKRKPDYSGTGYGAARATRYMGDKAMTENSCADSAILLQSVQRAGY